MHFECGTYGQLGKSLSTQEDFVTMVPSFLGTIGHSGLYLVAVDGINTGKLKLVYTVHQESRSLEQERRGSHSDLKLFYLRNLVYFCYKYF